MCRLILNLSHDCNANGVLDECDPESMDVGLFVTTMLADVPDPVMACMLDQNGEGLLNGRDIQPFVERVLGP